MEKEDYDKLESEISRTEKVKSSEKKQSKGVFILIFLIVIVAIVVLVTVLYIKFPKSLTDEQGSNISTNYSNASGISCSENWECANWTTCINESQERDCADVNNCTTAVNQPVVIRNCSSISNGSEINDSNTTCEEKFLTQEEHKCVGIEKVQRKWQMSNCTIEWKDFTYCPTNRQCNTNVSAPRVCILYSCEDLGGLICGQNKTCENNNILTSEDSASCCLSSCLNSTS